MTTNQIDYFDVVSVENMGEQFQVTLYDVDGGDLPLALIADESDAYAFRDAVAAVIQGWVET